MRSLFFPAVIISAAILSGCASSGDTGNSRPLTGIEWMLYELSGTKFENENGEFVTLVFDGVNKNINGKAPCNRYGGPYLKNSNRMTFGELYSTEMACDLLKVEEEYFRKLGTVKEYKLSGDKLFLYDSTGAVVMKFRPK